MAVIVKYIVVRNGVEKMTFTTKKEADAYDRMLDIADGLFEFIESEGPDIDEKLLEELTFFLSEHREKAMSILKGVKPKEELPSPEKAKKSTEKTTKKTKKAKTT